MRRFRLTIHSFKKMNTRSRDETLCLVFDVLHETLKDNF